MSPTIHLPASVFRPTQLHEAATLRLAGAVSVARTAELGLAALLTIAVAMRLPVLAGGQIDYDEGVYWQSLRAMAAGHPLFTSVYSSQPPAFLLLVFPAHLLLGGSIQADRVAMIVSRFLAWSPRTSWVRCWSRAGRA